MLLAVALATATAAAADVAAEPPASAQPGTGVAADVASVAATPTGSAPASPTPLYRPADGGFAAWFPEPPRYEDARSWTPLGALRTQTWEVERGALRTRVERHDVPALAHTLFGDDALLDRAARDLLRDLAARAPRVEPASFEGRPGRHLRYEPGERPGEIEDAWLYLLGHRLYVVFARGGDADSAGIAARFASSLVLEP